MKGPTQAVLQKTIVKADVCKDLTGWREPVRKKQSGPTCLALLQKKKNISKKTEIRKSHVCNFLFLLERIKVWNSIYFWIFFCDFSRVREAIASYLLIRVMKTNFWKFQKLVSGNVIKCLLTEWALVHNVWTSLRLVRMSWPRANSVNKHIVFKHVGSFKFYWPDDGTLKYRCIVLLSFSCSRHMFESP